MAVRDKDFIALNKVPLRHIIKWRFQRLFEKKDLSYKVPRVESVYSQFIKHNRNKPAITWIGHSTFLIQLTGLNIITDPLWANHLGTEKRLSKPGIPLNDLPDIDLVLISHNHYDHLDYKSIKKLKGKSLYLVPQGLKDEFVRRGFKNVREFNWWDSLELDNIKITFIPSLHWSRRKLSDLNTTLWGGWILQNLEQQIYFVGDTGYHNRFKEIGKMFTIDYVLMPIGAYEPEWLMKSQHVTPEEAVQSFIDLQGKFFIPMHYDAFRLANDTPKEALDRLESCWGNRKIEKERLKIMKLGETIKI